MTDKERLKFYNEIILPQQAARKMIKRGVWILIPAFLGSLVLFTFLAKWLPSILGFILFFGSFVGFYIVNNWIQWNALIVNQIHCPQCGELLAKRINLFLSPSPRCPNCKEFAIASSEQLENFKVEEQGEEQEVQG